MDVQNISGPDMVSRQFSVETVPRQESAPEEVKETERPAPEDKGKTVDTYA